MRGSELNGIRDGTGDAHRHQIAGVFETRIRGGETGLDSHGEFHVERGFKRAAREFAIAHGRVAVPQEEERAGLKHRQVERGALAHLVVIHVAAVGAEVGGPVRKISRGCGGKAADHGENRHREILHTFGGVSEHGRAFGQIEFPLAVEGVRIFGSRDELRRHGTAVDAISLTRRVAIHADLVQFDDERIAGQSAFNIKGTGFRVGAR